VSEPLNEQPFLAHLLELRDRLLRMVLAVLVLLLILFPFGNDIFTLLSQPVADALPEGSSMIATKVLSPFLTPLKLAFVASLFLAMPYLLYQLWGFIAPGLYQHERRLAFPMLASSIVLFYLGAAFAYFVVLPLLFPFLVGVVPDNVEVAPDIADFLDVAIKLFFAFGLAFEVPIATILLVVTGMTTPDVLAQKRPYIIVGAFVIGMLLTPPDIISQTLLAVPIWILFEAGVLLSRVFLRRKAQRGEQVSGSDSTATAATAAAGASGAAAAPETVYEGEYEEDDYDYYRELSEEEMEAELDRLEDEDEDEDKDDDQSEQQQSDTPADTEAAGEAEAEAGEAAAGDESYEVPTSFVPDAIDNKLEWVMTLREEGRIEEARTLLYEVLVEGNETQVKVAKNILAQLDS